MAPIYGSVFASKAFQKNFGMLFLSKEITIQIFSVSYLTDKEKTWSYFINEYINDKPEFFEGHISRFVNKIFIDNLFMSF